MKMKYAITGTALAIAAGLAAIGSSASASAAIGPPGSSATRSVTTARNSNVGPLMVVPPYHGCPYGDVCVYPANAGWNGDHPKYSFYTYGAHNIYGEYGIHRILDNQYGGHSVEACSGPNGTGVRVGEGDDGTTYLPHAWDKDLTPVNSFVLASTWGGANCSG